MSWKDTYSDDFKAKVIDLVTSGKRSVWSLALEPGYPSRDTINKWVRKTKEPPPPGTDNTHSHGYTAKAVIQKHLDRSSEMKGKRIAVIPDMQVKPDIDLSYASRIGQYLADKKPDIIINGGDFADMSSLSTYDMPGSKGMEGQRYKDDILAVQTAMRMMMEPINRERDKSGWNPLKILTLGNHEDRIDRAVKATPKLDGVIGLPDLHYEEHGWEVIPFLEPVVVEGVAFAHFFCSGVMGRPITTARALLNKKHMSCFAFHQQGRDIAFGARGDGRQMIGIIAGSCYEHDEGYLNAQTNNHWRGLYILNDVIDGEFEENAVSLRYLKRKYG